LGLIKPSAFSVLLPSRWACVELNACWPVVIAFAVSLPKLRPGWRPSNPAPSSTLSTLNTSSGRLAAPLPTGPTGAERPKSLPVRLFRNELRRETAVVEVGLIDAACAGAEKSAPLGKSASPLPPELAGGNGTFEKPPIGSFLS